MKKDMSDTFISITVEGSTIHDVLSDFHRKLLFALDIVRWAVEGSTSDDEKHENKGEQE